MKRLVARGLLLLLLVVPILSCAESVVIPSTTSQKVKVGSSVLVDETCTFTIRSTKPFNVFMNTSSGDAATFLVVTMDIINWKTEPLYLRTQVKASLEYDESFDFEPTFLWLDPVGTYRCNKPENSSNYIDTLRVYAIDGSGSISSNASKTKGGYEYPSIHRYYTGDYAEDWYAYYPEDDCFKNTKGVLFTSADESKTVLDPLVQRRIHYVFKVPNVVAKDEGLRVLTLSIGGNDYQLTF